MPYRATGRFDASHPTAAAVYCSDGRFTEAVEQLLHAEGHARLDTVTMPGGAALLNGLTSGFTDLDAVSRALSFLIRGHALTHVFLVAHAGCGYYRAKMSTAAAEVIVARQRGDLGVAAKLIASLHHQVTVRSFFASVGGEHVVFDEV